jgi:hypothetical protein
MPLKSRTRRLPPPKVSDLGLLGEVSTYLSLFFLPRSSHHATHVAHSTILHSLWASICSFPGKLSNLSLYDDAYTNDISPRIFVLRTLGGMETKMDVGAAGGELKVGQRGRRVVNSCIRYSLHLVLFPSYELMRVRI